MRSRSSCRPSNRVQEAQPLGRTVGRKLRLLVTMFTLLALGACAREPGQFFVEFAWGELTPPAPGSVEIIAEVKTTDGTVSIQSEPTPFEPPVRLSFQLGGVQSLSWACKS